MKPREKPKMPNITDRPRKYPDENTWLWTMYEDLEKHMTRAIAPLEEYLHSYDGFVEILKCDQVY